MSEYIPFEIQEEILKMIPVKPLLQFRSVSKSFKRLIDSPDFIVSYGVRHPQPPDHFILRYEDPPESDEIKYISLVDKEDDNFVQQEFVPTFPDLIKNIDDYSVVGSSHGLLCFSSHVDDYSVVGGCVDDAKEMVVVWNQSIRKSVGIQVPKIYHDLPTTYTRSVFDDVFGFGVCPVTSDPTILKIECIDIERKMRGMPGISVPWKVRVFTLSIGTWSILSTNLPRESIRLGGNQVIIDRFIYWAAYDYMLDSEDGRSQSHFLIMSFDLTAKEFKEINLPDSLANRLCKIKTISKLRESLVVLEYHRVLEEDVKVCSLWMMTKAPGVNRSFTKLYNINVPHAKVNTLLGFRKTGELILETRQRNEEHAELEIYNPSSEAIDNLGIEGGNYTFFMCSYMETLLLLDQVDGFMYTISN